MGIVTMNQVEFCSSNLKMAAGEVMRSGDHAGVPDGIYQCILVLFPLLVLAGSGTATPVHPQNLGRSPEGLSIDFLCQIG